MPTRPAELDRTERLDPLRSPETGGTVTIARDALVELYQRLAEAGSAIERGNVRIGGNRQLWGCVDAILRSGATPAGCGAAPAPKER